MNRTVLSALLSHWWRNKLQLITLLLGLALATALWSGVQAINAEARASYDAAAETLAEGQFDLIVARDGSQIPEQSYIDLRRAGWLVSPVVEGRINDQRIVGVDPLTAPGGIGPVQLEEGANIAAFVAGGGQLFAQEATFADLGPTAAAQVIASDLAPGTVLTDIGVAQDMLDQKGLITRMIVAPRQPIRQRTLVDVAPDLALQAAQGGSDVGRLTDSFHLNLTAFGLLSFAVGIFIVNGAVGLAFEQRRGVVRTMRAMGVPLRRLIVLIGVELLVFALVAGLIGVGLGYVIAAALLPGVSATLQAVYGAQTADALSFRPEWWLSGIAIALAGTGAAATAALWKLARMPLLASAQPRAWSTSSGRWWLQVVLSGGLLALAAVLSVVGSGIVAGFTLLGSLLIGGALALPLILGAALSVGARFARGPLAGWFWADTRQQLPGLSLALMALLLAMAANVGVSTMVSSFRLTFTGFLDRVLSAELYVATASDDQTELLLATATPHVREVLPLMAVDRSVGGFPSEVVSVADASTYRDNWTFLQAVPQVWDRLAAREGVLINEQLFRRADLELGSEISVADGTTLPVIGIFGDYGNPFGQAIVTEPLFRDLYPEESPRRFGFRLDPDDVPALRSRLTEAGIPDSALINQADIKGFSLEVFNRTFLVTGALNALTLGVAAFAILMSLLTLAALRVPQLAPVWAMGLTRKQLGTLELMRAVMLAALTAVVALPLGLLLAWTLLSVINVEAFGWQLPIFYFPLDYAVLGIFALIAAALAAAWPAYRLAQTPPADLLKVFSNER